MEQIPDQGPSRRQLLLAGASLAVGATFSPYESLEPCEEAIDNVEVLVANLSFIAPMRPDGLWWDVQDWTQVLNHTTYEGLEAHYFNTQNLRVVGAPLPNLLKGGLVRSFHQSVRSDDDSSIQSRVLPTSTESLSLLHSAENSARGGLLPLVVFPEGNIQAIEQAQASGNFASYSAQPGPNLFKAAGTTSLNRLRSWLAERRIGVCWASFHYQESEVAFGRDKLGAWQEILPAIVESPDNELQEIHLEIGRIDGSPELRRKTAHELEAFIDGPDKALQTTSGQMLATIFKHQPAEQRHRLVVEVNQEALITHLGALGMWPLREPIIKSHRRIAKTVRELAQT